MRTTFTFVNLSAARCTLRGWPSLRVVLPSGGSVAAASLRKNGSNRPLLHPRIVLRPGSAASFEVLYSDGVGLSHPCPGTRAVLVTPPGARQGLRLRFGMDYCGRGSVLVAPLVAGRSDRHWF